MLTRVTPEMLFFALWRPSVGANRQHHTCCLCVTASDVEHHVRPCVTLAAVVPSRLGVCQQQDVLLSCVCDWEPELQQRFCEGFCRLSVGSI